MIFRRFAYALGLEKSLPRSILAIEAVFCFTVYWVFHANYWEMPNGGLDPSWEMALLKATTSGFDFSRSFIFTYGPFGYFVNSSYHPDIYAQLIISRGLIVATMLIGATTFGKTPLLCFALSLSVASRGHAFDFIIVGFCLYILFLSDSWHKVKLFAKSLIILLLCILAQAKFSYFFLVAPLIFLSDLALIAQRDRSLPLHSIVFFVFSIVCYVSQFHELQGLSAYVKNVFEISGAYSKAMQVSYREVENIVLFLCLAPSLLFWLGQIRLRSRDDFPVLIIYALSGVWFAFITFKAGYVRADDGHVYMTWETLSICLVAWIFDLRAKRDLSNSRQIQIAGALLVPVAAIFLWNSTGINIGRPGEKEHSVLNARYERRAKELIDGLSFDDCKNIDSWPWDLTEIILMSKYHARPVPQSYTTYTPYLQDINTLHLKNDGPDCAIVNIKTIDNRYPLLDMGTDLMALQTYYDYDRPLATSNENFSGAVLLKKARYAKNVKAVRNSELTASLGAWIELPRGDARFRSAEVEMKPTLLGELRNFIFKQAEVWLDVVYESEITERYRFIPSTGRSRFLLSPLYAGVQTNCYFTTCAASEYSKVKRIRLTAYGDDLFFKPSFNLRLFDYDW